MSFYLGGFQIANLGWLGPQAVFVDFTSPYLVSDRFVWQLYLNRTLIGSSRRPGERRVVGQMMPGLSPAPLTLVRVDLADRTTDFGAQLPAAPWNTFKLFWSTAASSNIDHFEILRGPLAGDPATLLLAKVPFTVDGPYSFQAPPVDTAGTWNFAILARDRAGNAGTLLTQAILVVLPPDDIKPDVFGQRFNVGAVGGVCTANFHY